MPVYDYKCLKHGLFYELNTLDLSAKPCPCPVCGDLSARVIMVAPEFLSMKKESREARERNEKAQEQPILSTAEYRAEEKLRREHSAHKKCACGEKPIRPSHLIYTAQGNKMFPSMRPWMISH